MGGGLMQLVAYGAQDIYLTGNPQITFFKVVYRRHTNFSMESIQQTWNGTPGIGSRISSTISRNGDLIGAMFVEFRSVTWTDTVCNPGAAAIDTVECEIGGQLIDRQYGHWMETWTELTQPGLDSLQIYGLNDIATGSTTNIGRCQKHGTSPGYIKWGNRFQMTTGMGGVYPGPTVLGTAMVNTVHPISVPLYFWFCRSPGLALPLIALQYHEVKINLVLGSSVAFGADPTDVQLWVDYIYLDTDERRRFAQVSHEYLIEQLQYQTLGGSAAGSYNLNFNHPVKELIWTGNWTTGKFDEMRGGSDANKWGLTLNGHDRFEPRNHAYFSRTQVIQRHSGTGGVSCEKTGTEIDNICVYSFALKPEEHQPSGTCNFSRIDSAQLKVIGAALDAGCNPNVYAVNYNVLRIMSGMGGLAYSN